MHAHARSAEEVLAHFGVESGGQCDIYGGGWRRTPAAVGRGGLDELDVIEHHSAADGVGADIEPHRE